MLNRLFLSMGTGTVLLLAGCSDRTQNGTGATSTNAPILIEPKISVGKVHAGMTASDVVAALGEPQRRSGNALEYTSLGFAVVPNREGRIEVVMCGDVTGLNGPLVKAFTGRTAEGIGMNSTRDEIVKAYGLPDDSQRFTGAAESLHYISRGLTFTLEGGKVHHIIVRFPGSLPDRTIQLEPLPDAPK
jgi:hypothetical protein